MKIIIFMPKNNNFLNKKMLTKVVSSKQTNVCENSTYKVEFSFVENPLSPLPPMQKIATYLKATLLDLVFI